MSGKRRALKNKGTQRARSAKNRASQNRNKTLKRIEKEKIYLASKAFDPEDPSLTQTNQGYAYYKPKAAGINHQRLAELYHARILYNASIKDARNGIYTWIMKGDLMDFLGSHPNLDPAAYSLYSVRTCTKQEIGTIHQNLNVLTNAYSDDPRDIVAAGELEVRDGTIRFNLLSGTYMYKKRFELMKAFAANDRTSMRRLEKRANQRSNENESALQALEKTMFEEIAQRAMAVFTGKGLENVSFYAANNSAGGMNLIKHGVFQQEPENDPILCTYFDRIIVKPLNAATASASAMNSI
jgi:hypothetical protein